MKKLILAITASLCIYSGNAQVESPAVIFGAGYCGGIYYSFKEALSNPNYSILNYNEKHNYGFQIYNEIAVSKRFTLGCSFVYHQFLIHSEGYVVKQDNILPDAFNFILNGDTVNCNEDVTYKRYNFGIKFNVNIINKTKFSLYSGVRVGYNQNVSGKSSFSAIDGYVKKSGFTKQVLIGARYAAYKNIFVFAEFGFGSPYLFSGGIAYRFGE